MAHFPEDMEIDEGHYDNDDDDLYTSLVDSVFGLLPLELYIAIFRHLSPADMSNVFRVCRAWSRESDNESLWKDVAQQQFPLFAPAKPENRSWQWLCRAASNPIEKDAPPYTGLAHLSSQSLSRGGGYVGEVRDGVPEGVGIVLGEGKQYDGVSQVWQVATGDFTNGKLEGHAVVVYKEGIYRGQCKANINNGQGRFEWHDGDSYEGEWEAGLRHGKGVYHFPKGSRYEGDFVANHLKGRGRYVWARGEFEGQWVHSQRHGEGRIKWNNGNTFVGKFVHNHKNGPGVYTWSDGATYDGDWADDNRHGQATTRWANGMSYQGSYRADLRHGAGTLQWPNGDLYRGTWKFGGRVGSGVFVCVDTGAETRQIWDEESHIQYSQSIPPKGPKWILHRPL